MRIFDPFGWAARWLPEKWLHRSIRISVVLVLCFFIGQRIQQYNDFLLKPLWFVETLIYVVLAAAFLVRLDPVDRAKGVREILVPLMGGLLPFALLTSAPHPAIFSDVVVLHFVFWWMTIATALTAWGIWTLRQSFSITVEARAPITTGPYRWLRHPVYASEILTAAAVTAWRFSSLNLVIFALFVAIQLFRSYWEEQKLSRVFPAYAAWAKNTLWLW